MARMWRVALCATVLLGSAALQAGAVDVRGVDARVEAVAQARVDAYREQLAAYDAAIVAAPDDPAPAVARCRFLTALSYDDTPEYIEEAYDVGMACDSALLERWPNAPLARAYAFSLDYEDGFAARGEALLRDGADWPPALRADIAAKLSRQLEDDRPARAGDLAVISARAGSADRLPAAVRRLHATGDDAGAIALLRSFPPATQGWEAGQRISAAGALDDPRVASDELARHSGLGRALPAAVVARTHLAAGDLDGADKALGGPSKPFEPPALRSVRFDVAVARGDAKAAAAMLRIDEFDTSAQRWFELLHAMPTSIVQPPMLVGLVIVLVMVVLAAAAIGLCLLPFHHRGLARRLCNRPAVPVLPGAGLPHVWWAALVMLVVPFLVVGVVSPPSFAALMADGVPEGVAFARASLVASVVALLLLVPASRAMAVQGGLRWRAVPEAWGRILVAALWALGVSAALAWILSATGTDEATTQVRTIHEVVATPASPFAALPAFLMIVVAAPLLEELVFRGFVLGGLSRHIGAGWSNLLQSVAFALMHDDPPRFLYYLAVGLLAGRLVRTTGSLVPAIVLHALLNLIAFVLMRS